MLGWHVRVYRKASRHSVPASANSRTGALLAQWQGSPGALGWLDDLCASADAAMLGGDGYPTRYTVRCRDVRPALAAGPPDAQEPWVLGAHDVIVDRSKWPGRTVIDQAAMDRCSADEWLIIEAWDES